MRAAGPHWSLGARWPSSDRVAAWSFTGLLAAVSLTHVPHKWQGAGDLISQEPRQLLRLTWCAPETYLNNCRPNAVRLLSSTRHCNANSIGRNWKRNKKMFHSNLSPHFMHKLKTSSRFLSLLFPSWTFSATSHISLSQTKLWASAMSPEKEETLRCSTNLACGLAKKIFFDNV